jgi:ABC-type sulfate/molybdate transport systems ATPase subunit
MFSCYILIFFPIFLRLVHYVCCQQALLGELAPVPRLVVDGHLDAHQNSPTFPEIVNVPSVVCYGAVGYCAQEPWLPKGTLRDAILFGRPFHRERYLAAICASGLDSEILSSRSSLFHETDVGEGGSQLSGGQRARVQLARALYGDDVGVFLLDDPFSALDSRVGSIVYERLMNVVKQRRAAAVIVTHDPSVFRRCDRVILMGKSYKTPDQSCCHIVDVGTYNELIARGHDLHSINPSDKLSEEPLTPTPMSSNNTDSRDITVSTYTDENCFLGLDTECQSQIALDYDSTYIVDHQVQMANVDVTPSEDTRVAATKRSIKSVTFDDKVLSITVPLSTYIGYFKSIKSPLLIIATVISFLTSNGAQLFQQFIIARWTEVTPGILAHDITRKYLNLLIYAAVVSSLFLWLRSFLLIFLGTR